MILSCLAQQIEQIEGNNFVVWNVYEWRRYFLDELKAVPISGRLIIDSFIQQSNLCEE